MPLVSSNQRWSGRFVPDRRPFSRRNGRARETFADVLGSFEAAIARIKVLDPKPAFMIHTGDITHTQKPGAFDIVTEALKSAGVERTFYIPGENDVFADGGTEYLNRFAAGRPGRGWQSFDYQGVHFVGLINVLNFKAGGLGNLGPEQLAWLERKVEGNITFHTARSTAFPQPAPGVGPGPGPLKVPVEELAGMLGVRDVSYVAGKNALAIVDTSLGSGGR